MIALSLVLWYLSGVVSFIYWWTKDYDFKWDTVPITFFVGLIGPFAFLLGFGIHGDSKVIIQSRSK